MLDCPALTPAGRRTWSGHTSSRGSHLSPSPVPHMSPAPAKTPNRRVRTVRPWPGTPPQRTHNGAHAVLFCMPTDVTGPRSPDKQYSAGRRSDGGLVMSNRYSIAPPRALHQRYSSAVPSPSALNRHSIDIPSTLLRHSTGAPLALYRHSTSTLPALHRRSIGTPKALDWHSIDIPSTLLRHSTGTPLALYRHSTSTLPALHRRSIGTPPVSTITPSALHHRSTVAQNTNHCPLPRCNPFAEGPAEC